MKRYRLALDIGTNSIGWCAFGLEEDEGKWRPASILDAGVRIFPDGRNPKNGSSNAEARRIARSMRRNRDRFLERRNRLLEALVAAGLFPHDETERRELAKTDPYALRARGLREQLSPYEFGRAIFHLNQRRGFKSSRKQDAKDKETGAIKAALRTQQALIDESGASTFGEFLYLRRETGEGVRSRLKTRIVEGTKKKEKPENYYDFYPDRQLIEQEFDCLWNVQAKHHKQLLTNAVRERLRDIIFYQRPLKPQVVGKCTLEPSEARASKAMPLVHRFRIHEELNHLHILDKRSLKGTPLSLEQRDRLAGLLCCPKGKAKGSAEVSFNKMRTVLGLGENIVFSLESEKRKGLEGDTTSALLAHNTRFGARWHEFSDEEQERIVTLLLDENDEEKLILHLIDEWGLDRARAEATACTPLPDGYGRLSMKAIRRILAELADAVIPYSEAVVRAGYSSHSQFDTGMARPRLPYYGEVLQRHVTPDPEKSGDPRAPLEKRFGKITNPTVHIALNQLRKVVNEIIKLHGVPAEVHVEVLRELKNSVRLRKEIAAEQAKNQEINDECAKKLREEFNMPVSRENIQRLRLWSELGPANQFCVYTGEAITAHNLFSEEVEIDHILPHSRSLDDSMANKILCKRRANREKTNRTPHEAWGATAQWPDIMERCGALPKNKQWRFAEDAMARFARDRDFIARQLTDSQYIARLARAYLAALFNSDEEHKVVCLPGRLTGLFRHHLGLDDVLDDLNPARRDYRATRGEKNRNDHRHHAIDALVVGLMDRAFLQRAASTSARHEKEGVYRFLEGLEAPWPEFRPEARKALARIIVSHKPDHGIEAALHNDTAYGFADEKRPDKRGEAVHRVAAEAIKVSNILSIKGKRLRAELLAWMTGLSHDKAYEKLALLDGAARRGTRAIEELCGGDAKKAETRARAFFKHKGIRRVRLIEQIRLVPMWDAHGNRYKGFKPDGNAYLDILEVEGSPVWADRLVTCFEANTGRKLFGGVAENEDERPRKHVMRLFNRDMLEMEHEGERRVFVIQRMSEGQIALAEHFEANADSRTRDKQDPFRFVYKGSADLLRRSKVRFLVVTPAGRVRYLSDPPDDSQGG